MNKSVMLAVLFMAGAATASNKDKGAKVSFHQMALEMRDAFNCGLLVEKHLHGKLKDNAELYRKEQDTYHCDHVEVVLNTLNDQDDAPPPQ